MKLNEMKHFYENNDDYLRSKLNNHEFNFSSAAWDDMAKRLDKAQRAKGGAAGWWKWAWISMGIVAIGSAGIGWGLYAGSTAQEDAQYAASTPSQMQTVIASPKEQTATKTVPAVVVNNQQNKATIVPLAAVAMPKKTTKAASPKNKLSPAVAAIEKENKQIAVAEPATTNENIKNSNNVVNVENAPLETASPSRITRITHQYSLSNLYRLRLDSLADSKIRQQHRDIDSSLFQLNRVRDNWKSPWQVGATTGVTAKRYASGQNAVSGFVGVFTRWNANAKHAIEMGLQYKHLPHIAKKSEMAAAQMTFDGNASMTTLATIRDFHLLELPVAYRFSPHPKHHLLVGLKGSWIAGVRTNAPVLAADKNKKPLGINAFDASSFFGYEFSLCEHLALGFQYNLGFTNWTKKAASQYPENLKDNGFTTSNTPDELLMSSGTVPTVVEPETVINVPRSIRNNDLQIFVKYTF